MSEISGVRPGRRRSEREQQAHEQQRQRQIQATKADLIDVPEWDGHPLSETLIERRDEE